MDGNVHPLFSLFMDPNQQAEADQRRTLIFLDNNAGDLTPSELPEVEPLVGQDFFVESPDGPINEVTLTLERVDPQKAYTGSRNHIRKQPYALLFLGIGPFLNQDFYKLTSTTDSKVLVVFLKPYDQDPTTNTVFYEAIVN